MAATKRRYHTRANRDAYDVFVRTQGSAVVTVVVEREGCDRPTAEAAMHEALVRLWEAKAPPPTQAQVVQHAVSVVCGARIRGDGAHMDFGDVGEAADVPTASDVFDRAQTAHKTADDTPGIKRCDRCGKSVYQVPLNNVGRKQAAFIKYYEPVRDGREVYAHPQADTPPSTATFRHVPHRCKGKVSSTPRQHKILFHPNKPRATTP